MNNPLALMRAFRNPQEFMQKAMNNPQIMQNPISKNAIELYQRGDKQGLNELADNLCKEKGINRQDFENQIKSHFGI